MKEQIKNIIESYCEGINHLEFNIGDLDKMTDEILSLQLQQTGVMRCSSKEIDKFFKDTMYTDLTNYYGIIQKTKKGDYVKWKSPSQMIKDFFKWRKNNA